MPIERHKQHACACSTAAHAVLAVFEVLLPFFPSPLTWSPSHLNPVPMLVHTPYARLFALSEAGR